MGKNQITLIDTSSWIEALRTTGRLDVRQRVGALILNGMAAWCDMIAVELWNGAHGAYEKLKLEELEKDILCLPTTQDVWKKARLLAKKCREKGLTVPSADLVIASCALFHEAEIDHCDAHFDMIISLNGQK